MPASSAELPAAETRFAFAREGLSGLAMILGEPGARMVGYFQVHAVTQLAGYGPVQVLLHVVAALPLWYARRRQRRSRALPPSAVPRRPGR